MEQCIADNVPFFHSDNLSKECYQTTFQIIVPLFTKCHHQVFECWHCLVCKGNLVEEKVVYPGRSELRCCNPDCQFIDIYDYDISMMTDEVLSQVFGDLDAAVFK